MSVYVSKRVAEFAIDLVQPSIEQTLRCAAKRNAGCIRVSTRRSDGSWVILAQRIFGQPREAWEHDYEGHATAKERMSQRTGLGSREVQCLHPEAIMPGDTVYFGSVVSADGNIVVAYSGVEAFFDEMFAKWTLAAILALIEQKLEEQRATQAAFFS